MTEMVRIGGATAFFIDSALGVPQLLDAGCDYIILDYLAEGAMGLFGRMRAADPNSGYPADFLQVHVGPHLERIAEGGTRVVANAGGVNPAGLANELRAEIARRGLSLKVGCVSGDDLMGRAAEFAGTLDPATGHALPAHGLTSFNAYLGAFPIAAALDLGADIVVTGRVVDSALALGPLIHAFGWGETDFDLLAAGTLAGHIIECGGQATGGTFTDWREVEGWADIGFPIAECSADGGLVITKPDGTGGTVSRGTIAEQMLYEMGDPQAYIVPDVVLDISQVTLAEEGADRVRVAGARGYPPTATLKACATVDDGWRAIAYQPLIGPDAVARARKQAAAMFERCEAMLRARGLAPFRRTEAVLIGAGDATGNHNADATEIVLKLIFDHDEMRAAQTALREQFAAISAMAPGTSVSFGASVAPQMALHCLLIDKAEIVPQIDCGDGAVALAPTSAGSFDPTDIVRPPVPRGEGAGDRTVPLESLAWLRSGEKGETINIGVIARDPANIAAIREALSEDALRTRLGHLFEGETGAIAIYDVPGIAAINVLLGGALPGGINASVRLDPAAKSVAQQMLTMPVGVAG